LRQTLHALEQQGRQYLRSTAGVLVCADEPPGTRCGCGRPLTVEKTFRHHGMTLAHGHFEVRETVHACAHCRGAGRPVRQRQQTLTDLLLPRSTVGYDVMAFVGGARFVHHRQREEIRAALQDRYALRLSPGEVSTLARHFLAYLQALHEQRAPALRAALARDGGWPLHVDATGEDGRGTLLVVYAGWRGWVLGAWKIPTERADAILPRLREVAARFGTPCAIMRDLGKAVIEAAGDFIAALDQPIPDLACHWHLLKDVGKDLLAPAHHELRELFRRFGVVGKLRAFTRDLGRGLGRELASARRGIAAWLADPADHYQLPTGAAGVATVRALAQWVLDAPRDGHDEGFPFAVPELDLYRRCHRIARAVDAFLRTPGDDGKVRKLLVRLHRLLDPVRSELPFRRPAEILGTRGRLFTELRTAMRLHPKALPATETPQTLQDVKRALDDLARSLRERRPARGPAQDTRQAIDLILAHLERHGASLAGHEIALPGGGTRLVERTNNLLEGFFHLLKHRERRRSGRQILTQDLECLPPAAPLAFNLTRPDYVSLVCGSLDELPRAFAALDQADRRQSLPARQRATHTEAEEHDVVSASLPAADRALIRSAAMQQRVLEAARSRAPHYAAQ
jgi:hypothetical protein